MPKASVYIETSVISYLVARPSRDPIMFGRQQITALWWKDHRHESDLFRVPKYYARHLRETPASPRSRRRTPVAYLC